MSTQRWRIGIDCRIAGKKHAGIGRYIENLIIRLPALARKNQQSVEWVFFFYDHAQAAEFDLPAEVTVVIVPYRHYSLAEQLFAHRLFSAQQLDLLHVPHFNIPLFYRGKMVITIHDLLWHEYQGAHVTTLPMWKYVLKYRAYLFTVSQAIRRAAWIFVPAETVKMTLVKYYPFAQVKTEVTYEGIADAYREVVLPSATVSKAKRSKQLIYVGSLYPHKNVKLVIKSLLDLPEYSLLLAGTRNVFEAELQKYVTKLALNDRVEFKGYLSDQELILLYRRSFALIQPSLSEGFGLTGIEAMAVGIPVLASKIPIFQEIYQDAARYFDPLSTPSFVDAVHQLDCAEWPKILDAGKKIAAQYDWDRTAAQTFAAYVRILK